MARFVLWRGCGRILCREAAPVRQAATAGYGSANAFFAYEEAGCLPCARHIEKPDRLNSTSAQLTRSVVTQRSDPAAGVDRVDRAVTYVGLEIIENRATNLEVDPAEFFRRPSRSAARKKFE